MCVCCDFARVKDFLMTIETFIHPTTEKVNRSQIESSNIARINALKWLAKTFPEAFDTNNRVRPLKKGILEDIFTYLEEKPESNISKSKIRQAVVMFTRRMEYLVCVKCRNPRINLQGEYVDDVTDAEVEYAAEKIRLHVESAIQVSDKPPRSRRYEACDKFAPRARDLLRKEKKDATEVTPAMMMDYADDNKGHETSSSPALTTQVTVKRKINKRIDPEAVARLKAKLMIKKQESA